MQPHFTGTDPSDPGQSWRPPRGLLVRFCEIFVNCDPQENAGINSRYVDAIDPRLKPNQNLCQPHYQTWTILATSSSSRLRTSGTDPNDPRFLVNLHVATSVKKKFHFLPQ